MMTSTLYPSPCSPATPAVETATSDQQQQHQQQQPVHLARNPLDSSRTSTLTPHSLSLAHCKRQIPTRKHRSPSDVAKKLFSQVISSSSRSAVAATSVVACAATPNPTNSTNAITTSAAAQRPSEFTAPRRRDVTQRHSIHMPIAVNQRVMGGGISGIPSHAAAVTSARPQRPPLISQPTDARPRASTVGACPSRLQLPHANHVPVSFGRPQASTSGGAVTMTIQLAEPVLYLQGTGQDDYSTRPPAMLRGSLIVRISKATKIKAVTLTFRGKGRTEWPDGIPPKKSEYCEEKDLTRHTWPFFDYRFSTAELGHCADSYYPRKRTSESFDQGPSSIGSAISHLARSASPVATSIAANNRLSLQLAQSRSFSKGETPPGQVLVSQRGYRLFQPGDYVYNFELPVESCLPESIDVDLGSVKYELEGVIERPGAFRPNLIGKKEVVLVRVPSEANLESSEPISISRSWEDQLHYDIVISGKSFPLGSVVPISFKLTPLAKVRCHRIKIFITENIEYSCRNKKFQRVDPTKKVQLLEKRAEGPTNSAFEGSTARVTSGGGFRPDVLTNNGIDISNGTDNLLGDLNGSPNVGPTEMEFNVQLPGCKAKEKDRIHFDTTYGNIQVHHWIKIVMRLSKQDPNDPSKRRHFEISIDSPFHILSCQATHANTTLPAYNSPLPSTTASGCGCPESSKRLSSSAASLRAQSNSCVRTTVTNITNPSNSSIASTPPSLLSRQHSANAPPPPFDADSPPPLITPPPKYETIVNGSAHEGLADYFARLANEGADEDSDEEERTGRSRTLPPLTPGGRVARSMDERRDWLPISP